MGNKFPQLGNIGILILVVFCLTIVPATAQKRQQEVSSSSKLKRQKRVIDVKGGPESVIWVVQLSDLHFSVHHPDRALDFKRIVGPTLSMINPSLVLITGDLTDGKSKDLLIMKQIEEEWVEYQDVMEDVVRSSGLDKSIFYDLRGNHDNFGVPVVGASFDFFSKYSINGQLERSENVNSVTIQIGEQKHLFVGLDSTTSVGLRGPTNFFGHPTDQLLNEIDSELTQWDSQSTKLVTKISFGHFPLSFSASAYSGKGLKDVFLKHSLSAFLCGHLHTRFGKNLKRHHQSSDRVLSSQKFFQLNMHQSPSGSTKNCSFGAPPVEEFWEWEMGDWRKNRAMRILAIDRDHVSYVDIDFKLGAKKTFILPTFPVDSRFMSRSSSQHMFECEHMVPSSYDTVRALVFSVSPILSVMARVYDSRSGNFEMVMEAPMIKLGDNTSRGDLFAAPWNHKAFEDPSPNRYWLQIEATDITGRLTSTEPRAFSINGLSAKFSWTWNEFLVMGCQWAALYFPILWFAFYFLLIVLLIPKVLFVFSKKRYTYQNFVAKKGFINCLAWVLQDLCQISIVWFGMLGYLFYLILFPWLVGQVFTEGGIRGYMTYRGWAVKTVDNGKKHDYIGSPDVMVVVLPHIFFVFLPTIIVIGFLAAERGIYRDHVMSISCKKEDDYGQRDRRPVMNDYPGSKKSNFRFGERLLRKILFVVCFAICWKHFKSCRALMKAYEMNPLLHFPVYSFSIPLLLAYALYQTKRI
ncbi:Metallophos domain-containing protein [Cephalotus follicularis]|uniref:Metallophos domain-containing protein n=1 Tax=Cephalotus follicularis TaxID=3775 RepID=A0A1Q3CB72_CEPFO|nr:Metallophos domain-containing protein [Cephalotus follicularis]